MPSAQHLKSLIRMNLIQDNKVAAEEINLAKKVRPSNARRLKGKFTRTKPALVVGSITKNFR